jgi:transcriptional regulator with XRE-family HTH domain
LGVDRATLANYESGRRLPNDATVKKLAEMAGKTVPEFLFGEPRVDYKAINAAILERLAEEAAKRPGFIPKWSLSDDELAVIVALRLCHDHQLKIVNELVKRASATLKLDRKATGVPAYGEAHVERLKTALKRRYLEEGYDPDSVLFATLIEERFKREDEEGPN